MTQPMTAHAELIERLRAVYTKTDHRFGEFEGDCINPDGPEAAALIEALAERVRELEGALGRISKVRGAYGVEHVSGTERSMMDRLVDPALIAKAALSADGYDDSIEYFY